MYLVQILEGIMTQAESVSGRDPDWCIKFLYIVYQIDESDIPDTVDRALMEVEVTAAIEKAGKDGTVTESQLSLLDALCGRCGPAQSHREYTIARGLRPNSQDTKIVQASNNFSRSNTLLQDLGII